MIRPSGIKLCWRYSICCWMAIAIAGCGKSFPVGTTASDTTPGTVEPTTERTSEGGKADIPLRLGKNPTKRAQPSLDSLRMSNRPEAKKVALTVPQRPEYVYEPRVQMTQRDADTCLVKVGEKFPVAQLSDLAGQQRSLSEFFGEKLTVVVFWYNANRLGREQIQRLEAETVLPFKNAGVSVVAINIGDPPEQVSDLLLADRDVGFAVLLDEARSLYSKVATERHPRTYLLAPNGNVLWLDIEFSRSTARDLANAIHVYLGEGGTEDS